MHNCETCIDRRVCENKEKNICIQDLRPGDEICFVVVGVKKEHATVKAITRTLNLDFEEGWGINGLCISDIEILRRRNQ